MSKNAYLYRMKKIFESKPTCIVTVSNDGHFLIVLLLLKPFECTLVFIYQSVSYSTNFDCVI